MINRFLTKILIHQILQLAFFGVGNGIYLNKSLSIYKVFSNY